MTVLTISAIITLIAMIILMYAAYDFGFQEGAQVGMQIMEEEYRLREETKNND